MRRALTGVDGEEDVDPDGPGLTGVLSAGLPGRLGAGLLDPALLELGLVEPPLGCGRRLLGLEVLLELAGFSLGREVRNAPRTSSSSCTSGAAVPITRAQTQTNPKTITLNRILNLLIIARVPARG